MSNPRPAVTLDDIVAARQRLDAHLRPTPLVEAAALTDLASGPVLLKLETQQPTGAFKVRPALNAMLSNLEQARSRGVVASSSGNFAQAVAWAAEKLDVSSQIVMMRGASAFKRARTQAYGAEVVLCDDTYESRWETTHRIERRSGRLLLHPYDAPETIAGDGVIGLELLDQFDADFTVVVPISGGGLISGIATALKQSRPGCRVIGVQPLANPSMSRSFQAGRRLQVEPAPSLADALTVAMPGERTFELVQRYVDDIVLVSEDEMIAAVRALAIEQKLVVEPGGAVGVAALLAGKIAVNTPTVCVLSGGNIEPQKLARLLDAEP